jgi:hypothetical protein
LNVRITKFEQIVSDATFVLSSKPLNQLNPIPIRVFHKRNHRSTMFYRPCLPYHLPSALLDYFTSDASIFHFNRNVPIGIAKLIFLDASVMGGFNHHTAIFVGVIEKSQRKLPFGIVIAAQQFHAEHPGIKGE